MSQEKGPDVLLDSLSLVDPAGLVVSFVGGGPMMDTLNERARSHGIASHVRWRGLVNDAATLFSGFDLLVLSSRTEGSPMVLLEAMSMGTPVVATRVGGIPDMVRSSEAILVPPDDPGALARAITDVRNDGVAARVRADAARNRFDDDFGFDGWIGQYERIYRTLSTGETTG